MCTVAASLEYPSVVRPSSLKWVAGSAHQKGASATVPHTRFERSSFGCESRAAVEPNSSIVIGSVGEGYERPASSNSSLL
jgi:hypothetical protein